MTSLMRFGRFASSAVLILALLALAGCGGNGGNGGGGGQGGSMAATLSGTAATGAPIAGATVTVKDANGTAVIGTTDANGDYTADVTGLTAPFMVKVDLTAGGSLFSVGNAAGVVNIHPFTDLIVTAFYRVQGLDAAAEFADLTSSSLVPTPSQVEIIAAVVGDIIRLWLTEAGLDPDEFDLITTPFTANGTGFDAVLDIITVTDTAGVVNVVIDDGAGRTQSTNVSVDTTTSEMTADTTTTAPDGTTNSTQTSIVPTTSAQQAAVDGAKATLEQFKNTVNSRGNLLADSDLTPILTSDFLDHGNDRTLFSGEIADFLRGITIDEITIDAVHDFDEVNEILDLTISIYLSQAGVTQQESIPFSFKRVGSSWLFHGNRRVAEVSVLVEMRIDVTGAGTTAMKSINVDVRAPIDTVQSVTIDGGGTFTNTALPLSPQIELVTFDPVPGTTTTVQRDTFFTNSGPLAGFPPPGTVFTVTITPVVGAAQSIEIASNGTTTEQTTITSPTGNTLADVNLGGTLSATWTLPETFAVVDQDTAVHLLSASFSQIVDVNGVLGPETTSATYNPPSDLNGESVTSATLNVSQNGPNGERIIILFFFE